MNRQQNGRGKPSATATGNAPFVLAPKRSGLAGNLAPALAGGMPLPAQNRRPDSAALVEELDALRAQYTDLQQAVNAAAQLQRMLCSPRSLERGEFQIASEIFPVRYLSGDFCKVLELGDEIGLVIGDIAGKGVSAGMWLAHLLGLVRKHAEAARAATTVAEAVNRDLCRWQPANPLTALFFGRLNPVTGELAYCNAGLPAPLLQRRNGAVEWLQEGGAVLGIMADAAFACGRARLEPGDTLIAYSDGISEARNVRDEEFGSKGLVTAARAQAAGTASTILYSLIGAVQDFAASRPRGDDLTLMIVRRRC
jgi:sigma-B regulation protein RsbU (phosphoserine phosphatase)